MYLNGCSLISISGKSDASYYILIFRLRISTLPKILLSKFFETEVIILRADR